MWITAIADVIFSSDADKSSGPHIEEEPLYVERYRTTRKCRTRGWLRSSEYGLDRCRATDEQDANVSGDPCPTLSASGIDQGDRHDDWSAVDLLRVRDSDAN